MRPVIAGAIAILALACSGDRPASPPPTLIQRDIQKAPPAPPPPPPQTKRAFEHPILRIPHRPQPGEIVRYPDVGPKVMATVPAKLTPEAEKVHAQGFVLIEVLVETDGHPSAAKVLKPLPFGLTAAAIESVRRWRFEPATVRGRPVRSTYVAKVAFGATP